MHICNLPVWKYLLFIAVLCCITDFILIGNINELVIYIVTQHSGMSENGNSLNLIVVIKNTAGKFMPAVLRWWWGSVTSQPDWLHEPAHSDEGSWLPTESPLLCHKNNKIIIKQKVESCQHWKTQRGRMWIEEGKEQRRAQGLISTYVYASML